MRRVFNHVETMVRARAAIAARLQGSPPMWTEYGLGLRGDATFRVQGIDVEAAANAITQEGRAPK